MSAPVEPNRRSFFRRIGALAATSGAALLAASRTSGYRVDPLRARRLRVLAPWELCVVDAVADRLCAADVPYDSPGAPPTPLDVDVGAFFDAYLVGAAPSVARDLTSVLALVEHGWPLWCRASERFTRSPAATQDALLAAMESSSIDLMRGAFFGLKSVVMMGYYRDPRTWGVLGYDGPRVARPTEGWVPLTYRRVGWTGKGPDAGG